MKRIILASSSPRRRSYMERMLGGAEAFSVRPADIDEPLLPENTPIQNAEILSLAKAEHVFAQNPDSIVVASDTIVAVGDQQLAKPEDRQDAEAMLRRLLGRTSLVITGLAILSEGKQIVLHDITEVVFRDPDEPGVKKALETYLDSNDWMDKAGAYGIQSGAGPLIKGIKGRYSTIVGLPVDQLSEVLNTEYGITANQFEEQMPDGIEILD